METTSPEHVAVGEYEDIQRDLRKMQKQPLTVDRDLSRSCPDLGRDGIITASSLAQIGGFRREFLYRESDENEGHVGILAQEIEDNALSLVTFFGAVGTHTYVACDGGGLFEDMTTCELISARNRAGSVVSCSSESRAAAARIPGKLSVTKACVSTFKAFIGIGILFIPQAMTNAGWLGSPIMLLASAFVSTIGILLLGECHQVLPLSYPDMAWKSYGDWGYRVVAFQLALSQSCFATAGIIFVVRMVGFITHQLQVPAPSASVVCITFGILLIPFSWIRRIGRMKVVNLVGDVLILGTVIAVCASALMRIHERGGVAPDVVMFNWRKSLVFAGTSVYAFEGVALVIPIRESMARPEYFNHVLSGMMVLFFALLSLIGLAGYLAWGAKTDAVVLNEVPLTLGIALDIAYFFVTVFSFPIQMYPTFSILEASGFASMPPSKKRQFLKNLLRTATTMLLALVAFGAGSHLSVFVSFVGSFCSVPLAIVFPALLHMKIVGSRKVLCSTVAAIGTALIPFTLYIDVQEWLGGAD